ncbi:hypothetical protein QZM22_19960 [Burkholderia oklahomensis]|uniref:hypothetical protein n=1 Tax=Burkholderia oklahomensis TaxID=342113 RepID=UPI00264F6495|nr:hypothetical protein [Burkholderia oklahomensis]MDN7674738.1 hypothetical protein [Burkholderia oklahomensis]
MTEVDTGFQHLAHRDCHLYFSTRVWVLSRLPYHGATAGTAPLRSRRDTLGAPACDSARTSKTIRKLRAASLRRDRRASNENSNVPAPGKNSDFSVDLANKYSMRA